MQNGIALFNGLFIFALNINYSRYVICGVEKIYCFL